MIDIMKIDVEGSEVNVLNGASMTLKRARYIIIEISLARDISTRDQAVFEIFQIMYNAGFLLYSIVDLYKLDEPMPHLGVAQFDAIFRNYNL